ncbi:MAG: 16S rRNA (cytosine(1402)-N(4))-methyltransferase RsmH [Bacteroidetes bacterium]|nr:16S rRNA (cytosine(1402)-N(4))-methyltransferase RsmH [Bacteroidota bacterium]MDA1121079.1 16S rRNA (cytosine(1402)-N(4))-methyltransferase RsmH [Bacteroidota bacterium]
MTEYHMPVMLTESVQALKVKPDGIYVDLTFGGGGHSKEILKRLDKGHLYAFDQDTDTLANAEKIEDRSFTFIKANFRYLTKYLKVYEVTQVDGILGDLGISSHQIDEGSRGFSTRMNGSLDMRMNRDSDYSAFDLVNTIKESDMKIILSTYGEVKNAGRVAKAICVSRVNKPIETTGELVKVLERLAPRGKQNKFFAQVFQAIRIEVNDEMDILREVLEQSAGVMKKGGTIAFISYHSLEDRMVKNFFNNGKIYGDAEKDIYGNVIRPFMPMNRKPITAGTEEIARNKRARSAKLRVAEKL